jgi:hypothetical protein
MFFTAAAVLGIGFTLTEKSCQKSVCSFAECYLTKFGKTTFAHEMRTKLGCKLIKKFNTV